MSNGTTMKLIEGVDYYVEKGMYVWTAHYLRNRGYCCDLGCRHCPYKPAEKIDDDSPPQLDTVVKKE